MKRAQVAYGGAIHEAYEHPAGLKLADGRVVAEDAVVWLPPFEVGTIIACPFGAWSNTSCNTSTRLPTSATLYPAFISAVAAALPTPVPAPVTIATFE